MNEYTRREEVRWTFIAATTLVLCIAAAIVLLLTAKGPLVPDPAARQAADVADARVVQAHGCAAAAEKLVTEIDVFKATAKAARLRSESPDAGAPIVPLKRRLPAKQEKAPDVELAWPSAVPSYKQAKLLAPCRLSVDVALGARPEAAPAWDAIGVAAAVEAPPEGDKQAQIGAARKLLGALQDAAIDKVLALTKEAETAAKTTADAARQKADAAQIRQPLPKGALSREVAVALGVALALIALLLSFLSVRSASMRRAGMLMPLREVGKTPQRGLQAAAILKLAGQHNGGEPGLVIGAALGGLIAALIRPLDSDVFVGGVMAGLPIGLGVQWAYRLVIGHSSWRKRATELGDIEKPTIPIVLILSGVNPGLEPQFMKFFEGLSPQESAATVEKLAAQAEEKILAAAEAGAAAAAPPQQQQAPYGMPPGGTPPQ